jgi:hypothetical protein
MKELADQLRQLQAGDIRKMMIEQSLNKLFVTGTEKKEERFGLHASAILEGEAKFCYREQVLSLFYKRNHEKDLPISLLRIFKQGNVIHEKWQNLFVAAGIAIEVEKTHFKKKYDLSYTPDAEVRMAGGTPVVEIKSMNGFAFAAATGKSKSKKWAGHPSGRKQCNFYLHMRKLDWGFVLMEDKSTQNFEVEIVEYDRAAAMPYIERLEIVQEYKLNFVNDRRMPKKHAKCTTCSSKRAMECPLRDACWNVGRGRVKLDGVKL